VNIREDLIVIQYRSQFITSLGDGLRLAR